AVGIPQMNGAIISRRRGRFAIGGQGEHSLLFRRRGETMHFLAGGPVPLSYGLVGAARRHGLGVGRETYVGDMALMIVDKTLFLAVSKIPQPNRTAGIARRQRLAVRGEREAIDVTYMTLHLPSFLVRTAVPNPPRI